MTDSLNLSSIQRKREEMRKVIADAEETIASAKAVLADLDASERILAIMSGASVDSDVVRKPILAEMASIAAVAYSNSAPEDHCQGNPFRKGTNKAYIWDALMLSNRVWIDANEIQERASALKGEEIAMASISPMLSNMKGEHIERKGLRVALKLRLNENGEAEASPDVDEVAASSDL